MYMCSGFHKRRLFRMKWQKTPDVSYVWRLNEKILMWTGICCQWGQDMGTNRSKASFFRVVRAPCSWISRKKISLSGLIDNGNPFEYLLACAKTHIDGSCSGFRRCTRWVSLALLAELDNNNLSMMRANPISFDSDMRHGENYQTWRDVRFFFSCFCFFCFFPTVSCHD